MFTANEAGKRPSTLGLIRADLLMKKQLIGSDAFASAGRKCSKKTLGSIAIRTTDPYSMDAVKRVYESIDFFPETALIPRSHGFTVTMKCRGDADQGDEKDHEGMDIKCPV